MLKINICCNLSVIFSAQRWTNLIYLLVIQKHCGRTAKYTPGMETKPLIRKYANLQGSLRIRLSLVQTFDLVCFKANLYLQTFKEDIRRGSPSRSSQVAILRCSRWSCCGGQDEIRVNALPNSRVDIPVAPL